MKIKKIFVIFIITILTIMNLPYSIYATDYIGQVIEDGDSFLGTSNDEIFQFSEMKDLSDTLFNAFFGIGMALAVIIGLILGIKYMFSGIDGQAEEKKKLFAYFIGCLVLFGGFGIWKLVVTILQKI